MQRALAVEPGGQPTKGRTPVTTLPTLPSDWKYKISLQGPDEAAIEVQPDNEAYEVTYGQRTTTAPDLHQALKVAQGVARNVGKAKAAENEARKAREEAIGAFGSVVVEDKPQDDAPPKSDAKPDAKDTAPATKGPGAAEQAALA
jgi:hypothetical protein